MTKSALGEEYRPLTVLPPRTFETERLMLRTSAPNDAAALFDLYARDPIATKYMSFKCTGRIDETREFLQGVSDFYAGLASSIRDFQWLILDRKSGELIGACGFGPKGDSTLSGGYILGQQFWGMGYATEAFKTLVDWAKMQPGVQRIEASVHPENIASCKVLAKCGLTNEGIKAKSYLFPNIADEPMDAYLFGWSRSA